MMRRFLCLSTLSIFGALCSLQAAESDLGETLLGDSIFALENVTVIASRKAEEVVPVQTLSGETLHKLSVYSVADALRYFAGVQIKDYGGIGGLKTVNVRSMGSHHVGVFYDGIAIGNAQNGVVDLGRFSLDNMEALSLYNGQKSAVFQSAKDYASASAVYLQTRKPFFVASRKNNLNIGLKGGSFETINPSVLWEHRINSGLSLSVSSEYLYTSGRYKFSYSRKNGYDTTEVRKNGDVSLFRVEAALFGTLPRGGWQAKAYYYNSERGYPGASVREEPGRFKHQDRQWDENFFLQASFRKNIAYWYSLQLKGKYAYDFLHYRSDPRVDVTTMYVDNRYTQQEGYLSLAHLFTPVSGWSISLANDLQYNTLDADLIDFVYPYRTTLLTALSASFAISRFNFQSSLLHTYVNDQTQKRGVQAGEKSVFTPTIVAGWRPFPHSNLQLRAFYKRIFRMPTLNDLYYTFIGNKDLKPEYTTQYDVGLTYEIPFRSSWVEKIAIQIDGYFNQVEDKIIAMPTSNQFRWTMINLGYVEILGVDASLQGDWEIGNVALTTRLTYTYQQAEDRTDKTSRWYGGQIPYIPWHSGSAIVTGSYKSWSWNYSFLYTGERYEAVANIPENYALPWYTHDLSLSKTFQLTQAQLRVSAEVNNLFNQQYEVVQCYPMPGTNFKVKLNLIL